jgi:hypothetical protein
MCASTQALDIDPFKGPKPIAVLIQTDPWLDVIGSDTPMVAVYDDGRVIYLRNEKGKPHSYYHVQLSSDALAKVVKTLSTFGDYAKVKRYYNLVPNVTDRPETWIYLALKGKEFVTGVYGLSVPPNPDIPRPGTLKGEGRPDELPKAVKDLHAYLTSLDFADAKPWEPQYVEAMIRKYEYAPDKSILWPKNWPGLDSPSTLKRRDQYSIFLPGKELPKLRDFLKTCNEKGAVEIGGKKWAVSYRFTFPSEPVWRKAFSQPPHGRERTRTETGNE